MRVPKELTIRSNHISINLRECTNRGVSTLRFAERILRTPKLLALEASLHLGFAREALLQQIVGARSF